MPPCIPVLFQAIWRVCAVSRRLFIEQFHLLITTITEDYSVDEIIGAAFFFLNYVLHIRIEPGKLIANTTTISRISKGAFFYTRREWHKACCILAFLIPYQPTEIVSAPLQTERHLPDNKTALCHHSFNILPPAYAGKWFSHISCASKHNPGR